MREYTVKSKATVTDKDIAYWAITAFEGAITYWCDFARAVERDENGEWVELRGEAYDQWRLDGCGPYTNPDFWDNDRRGYKLNDAEEGKEIDRVLTLSAMLKALQYQPRQREGVSNNWYRKVVDRLLSEDYDAGDADTLVQVAVFGEPVYG